MACGGAGLGRQGSTGEVLGLDGDTVDSSGLGCPGPALTPVYGSPAPLPFSSPPGGSQSQNFGWGTSHPSGSSTDLIAEHCGGV